MTMRCTAILIASFVLGCAGDSDSDDDDDTSSSSGSEDTNPMTLTDATLTSSMTATMGSMSATTDDTTESSGPAESTGPADSSGSDSGASSEGSSDGGSSGDSGSSDTTGGGGDAYPACDLAMDPPCPEGFDECVDIENLMVAWCTVNCAAADECPVPSTGDATVQCAGPGGDQCALSCADGETCPDGMECVELVPDIVRCVWPY